MKKKDTLYILLVLLVISGISIAYFYYSSKSNNVNVILAESEKLNHKELSIDISNFSLYDMSGNIIPIVNLKKKANLIYFWTSWCSNCKIANQRLKEIEDKMVMEDSEIKNKVKFITINIDRDAEVAKKYIKENAYPFDVFFDIDSKLSEYLNVEFIPTIYLANADLTIGSTINIRHNYEEIIAQIRSYL